MAILKIIAKMLQLDWFVVLYNPDISNRHFGFSDRNAPVSDRNAPVFYSTVGRINMGFHLIHPSFAVEF